MDTSVSTQLDTTTDVNIYHASEGKHFIGWVILTLSLTSLLILFIILWVFCVHTATMSQTGTCFGTYGIQTSVDANPINQCGSGRTGPCVFAKNSLADCETECDNLRSICNAFTFNFSTSTMKIVNSNTIFTSPSSNLFVRQ